MAIKGYRITEAVRARLANARAAIRLKIKDPNALKPNNPKYRARKKASRKKNRDLRNIERARNYAQARPLVRKNRPWTHVQINLILAPHAGFSTDRDLAIILNRSVQAIQQKRYEVRRDYGSS